MTGFGQAEVVAGTGSYRVEIRGVNNRYLDIQLRIPKALSAVEQRIRQAVQAEVARGSLTVTVNHTPVAEEARLTWERESVDNYMAIFRDVIKTYGLRDEITLSDLLHFSDFIKTEAVELPEKSLWRDIAPALTAAMESFQKSRSDEGRHTERDLRKSLRAIQSTLTKIEKRAPTRARAYGQALRGRLGQLTDGIEAVDENRVAMEVALMADKLDISEECARLRAHVSKFVETLASMEAAGKHLNFLLQEMNREANTICSKANDTQISHWGITLKEHLERMREQVQNVE